VGVPVGRIDAVYAIVYIQMLFKWDEQKNRSNRRNHGISFDTAARVFLDPLHMSRQDRIVDGEGRWQTIGRVNDLLVLVAYTVVDEEDEIIRIISARKVLGGSKSNMKKQKKSKTLVHELKPDRPMTARQKREIQALAIMPEGKIDTSDIPELPPGAWQNAVRGKWYRPVKQAVSIRLDADVLAWLKAKGDGYQTRVNGLLRERMLEEISK
jgi:uncharacterized DUF497 family protein/uncharacterized protein (DUF4415 family)